MGLVGLLAEIVVFGSLAAALVCNSLLLASCELLELKSFQNKGSMGLFEWSIPGVHTECETISDVSDRSVEDAALKCARACGILAMIFGGIVVFFGVFKQYLCPLPCSQIIIDIAGFCTQIFLALVYIINRTDTCDAFNCSWGDGVTYLFLTQIFYLIASVFTRCMREGRSERKKNAPPPEPKEKKVNDKPKKEEKYADEESSEEEA